ncbi:MAG: UDP-N-acetylmuramoyl-L-alanyl-D-glutamate--2,6-diaminopimelate ligase [Acidobacteriota bacterium]|nr:UDP-N-acetylmuramoyl-L-alanyl-D-glutamate--2,6-diaminopimelate ligase [Acidobacteriota bacterium]
MMQLGDLLEDLTLDVSTGRVEVSDVQVDSRACGAGSLFFALPGRVSHGAQHAHDAVARGAVAVVAAERVEVEVPVVEVPASQLRMLLAEAAAAVVGHPELDVDLVGVTGTNGKTTVATLVASLARAMGWNGASVGTLTNERTTPAPPELFRTLARLAGEFEDARSRSVVAIEVSSHALDQGRVDGLCFAAAAFTNLGHDHLDYHGTMEAYFAAKARLFESDRSRRAVIWVDDPYGWRLAQSTSLPVVEVRRADAGEVATSWRGSAFSWRGLTVTTPLIGGFNIDDALVAMAVAGSLGASDEAVAEAMSRVETVPGRFEVVARGDVVVVVDYAHTPEGLERILRDVRELTPHGRVVTVFGCGGDRDREKRPLMGEVASRLSDAVVVTSDNPRNESPGAIAEAVAAGAGPGADVRVVLDRRAAIGDALGAALAGDVVVIAGKGHETTQTIGDEVVAFDDRAVARELLEARC